MMSLTREQIDGGEKAMKADRSGVVSDEVERGYQR